MLKTLLPAVALAAATAAIAPNPAAAQAAWTCTDTARGRLVTANTLNVRAQPNTKAQVIGKVARNALVCPDPAAAAAGWYTIKNGTTTGYVLAQWTRAYNAKASAPAPKAANPKTPAKTTRAGNFELGAHFKEANILGRMSGEAGMTWAKYQVVMPGGAPDISGLLGAARASGIKLLIGAVGDRSRASDANYHKQFAAELAKLAAQGADAIEVWNEPNLDREYGGSGSGQVSPENYANMLREAYGAIKSANLNTLVISGATAPTGYFGNCTTAGCDDALFVQRLAATGAAAWMDCIGAHHNGTMVGPDQQSGAPVGSPGHHQWYFQGTLAVNYNAFGGQKPVCWTELGYVTKDGIAPALPGGFAWGNGITLQNQSDWLRRAAELSRASGIVRIMIIWNADFRQFDDDPQAGYSIFRPDGSCPACGGLRAAMGR
jgi:hypothetical protein